MSKRTLPRFIAFLLITLLASGCDSGNQSNDTNTNEPEQILPAQFTDTLGGVWTCPAPSGAAELTGEINIDTNTAVSRADIVHIMLVKLENDQFTPISHKCINNILFYSSDFTLPYTLPAATDGATESSDLMYLLSTRFFKKTEDGTYQLTLGPDGLTQVISNELVDDIKIYLEPF